MTSCDYFAYFNGTIAIVPYRKERRCPRALVNIWILLCFGDFVKYLYVLMVPPSGIEGRYAKFYFGEYCRLSDFMPKIRVFFLTLEILIEKPFPIFRWEMVFLWCLRVESNH